MNIRAEKNNKKRFDKEDVRKVVSVAWPSALESFFVDGDVGCGYGH